MGSMNKDLYNIVNEGRSIAANEYSATADGTAIDLQGYESCEVIVDVGVIGGTDTPTFPMTVQESDASGSGFTDVAAADLQGGLLADVVAANDDQLHVRGYIGEKRYVRVQIGAVTGTNPVLDVSATFVKSHARHQPV